MRFLGYGALACMVVLALVSGGCGGSSGSGDQTPTDTVVPAISDVTPASTSILKNSDIITFTFSESIDTATLALGGSMAAESDGGTWSTTTVENDTLTISPATVWSTGTGTLTMTASDTAGNTLTTLSASKEAASANVVYGIQTVYVRAGESGNGTMVSPLGDITAGIMQAANNFTDGIWDSARVDVAEGTYAVASGTSHIQMVEGVSLAGGFSATDWSLQDPTAYPSIIEDTVMTGGTDSAPNRPIDMGSGLSNATVLEGFTVKSGGGKAATAIFIHDGASPVLLHNKLLAQSPTDLSVGIFITGSSPVIVGNYVHAGTPTDGSAVSVGIADDIASSIAVYNNTIDGGTADTTIGVGTNGDDSIRNNIIDGGSGTTASIGVYIDGDNVNVENNIIFTSAVANGWGLGEDGTSDNPGSIRNNDIFDCPTGLYHDADGDGDLTTVAAMEADLYAEGVTTGGNVSINPAFVDQSGGDWHFTGALAGVTDGGLDGSERAWGFATDKDGTARTAPWSIGAYEHD
jgi:hypothetical protein